VQIIDKPVPLIDRSVLLQIVVPVMWILMVDPVVGMIDDDLPATRRGSHDAIEKTGDAEPKQDN
jgi:hypothetical protein